MSEETKWTLGPWGAEDGGVYANWDDPNCAQHIIVADCVCEEFQRCAPRGQVDANAALIAAAPDLYEALRKLVELDDGDNSSLWPHAELFERARAALAKASPQSH